MKFIVIASLLALLFTEEATSTHLQANNYSEIGSAVNNLVGLVDAHYLELISTTLTNITDFHLAELENSLNKTLHDMEISLTSIMKRLVKPIKDQLNYHLRPPPTTSPTQAPTQAPTHATNSEENPARSCKELYSNDPNVESGYYWIQASSDSPVRVYCKMDADCGNMTGGWMRVAYIDMTNSSHQCPSGLTLTTRSSEPRRVCDVPSNYSYPGTNFASHGVNYSHVYGRIKAYQNRWPVAFYYGYRSIDEFYVHGISLTHGRNPRKHIWTFVGAGDESSTTHPTCVCPCTNPNIDASSITIPSFVENDYFCDTSLVNTITSYTKGFYPSDPLWDGEGCGPTSTCCNSVPNLCGNNSSPWVIKRLPSYTTDDVEMRVCAPCYYGSTSFEQVEIYVQ